MHKLIYCLLFVLIYNPLFSQVPNTWEEKNGIGQSFKSSARFSPRSGAIAFVIGTKAYIGGGHSELTGYVPGGNMGLFYKDLWEVDPVTGVCTQKSNIPGLPRGYGIGFEFGGMGYAGLGVTNSSGIATPISDFYQYNASTNTWVAQTSFPGTPRYMAAGSVRTNDFVLAGGTDQFNSPLNDVWTFAPSLNNWFPAGTFPGGVRRNMTSFSVGNIAYFGGGFSGIGAVNDFWELNGVTWTQRPNLPFSGRAFSLNNKGYVPGNVLHVYTPSTNLWTFLPNSPAVRNYGVAFSIGTKGYFGLGEAFSGSFSPVYNDLFEFDGTSTWTTILPYLPNGEKRTAAVSFSIGTKGYIGLGISNINSSSWWEVDPVTNVWTQKANFIGNPRANATAFSIGSKGYVGTGKSSSGTEYKDFYEYNPATNAWTQLANFGGVEREGAVGFSIGTKGYIGTGRTGSFNLSDFWEYNPSTNAWTAKASLSSAIARTEACGFSIGSKGYISCGIQSGTYFQDLREYNPQTNTWTLKAALPVARQFAASFSTGNKGFISGGSNSSGILNDLWEYDQTTNAWVQRASFSGIPRYNATAFAIGGKGYLGSGNDAGEIFNDFWEYNTVCVVPPVVSFSGLGASYIVTSPSVSLTGSPAGGIFSGPGISGNTFNPSLAGVGGPYTITYSYTDANGCSNSSSSQTTVNSCTPPVVSFSGLASSYSVTTSSVTLTGSPAGGIFSGPGISGNTFSPSLAGAGGPYTITYSYTDVNGCSNTSSAQTTVTSCTTLPGTPGTISISGGTPKVCAGESRIYTIPAVSGATSYTWTPPAGSVILSGQGSVSITLEFNGGFPLKDTLRVVSNNMCGSSAQRKLAIYRNDPLVPSTIVVSGGAVKVCASETRTYTIPVISNALSYTWSPPAGSVILSGQGTVSIVLEFNSGFPLSDTLRVVSNNLCGSSAQRKLKISRNDPVIPGTISAINGNTKVCPGDVKIYSIVAVASALSYTWTPPDGSTITSGQGTTSVTVAYDPGFTASDTIFVKSNNNCGSSANRFLKITRNTPAVPGTISGLSYGTCNLTGVPYSVTNVAGINYNWYFNNVNAVVASGQGTNSITANFIPGFISGPLSVTATNGCGTSAARSLSVNSRPSTPVSITGPVSVCANQQDVPYSIAALSNVTNYTWSAPVGSVISDGVVTTVGTTMITTANAVTIDFGSSGGNVQVRGNNTCASGAYKALAVAINCREGQQGITDDATENILLTPNPNNGLFTLQFSMIPPPGTILTVTDIRGRIVAQRELTSEMNQNLEMNLNPGMYYVTIQNSLTTTVKKMLVQF